jgi:hypothetical protein
MRTPDGQLVLDGVQLEGEDFSGQCLDDFSISNGSRLTRCSFQNVRAIGGSFGGGRRPSIYVECIFDGSQFTRPIPGRAKFVSCSFHDVSFDDMFFLDAELLNCVFSGQFKTVVFSADPSGKDEELGRSRNEYLDNDFSNVVMADVAFRRGIDLSSQRLPVGPDYLLINDAAEVVRSVWKEVKTWPEKAYREEAKIILEVLYSETKKGQVDIFVQKSQLSTKTPLIADRLHRLLSKKNTS